MICFPLDNTPYEAKEMGAYLATRTRGVFSSNGNLAVSPGESGLSVSVSPGLAWLKWSDYWGVAALQEQSLTLKLDTADGILKRIDAIVCRLDKVTNRAEIIVKKGSLSSSPVVAPPVRDANYDELYIATVLVNAGVISISAGAITDQRLNEEYCGLMRDGVTGIPTASLQAQAQQILTDLMDALNAQMVQQSDEFNIWFNDMKEKLGEAPATALQLQVDELKDALPGKMDRSIYDKTGLKQDVYKYTDAAIARSVFGYNYLDNSDFTDPVNQRGMGSPFMPGYCIDRWICQTGGGGRCGLMDGGISFTAPGGTLKQILPKALGTDVTPSLGVLSGEYNVSARYDDSTRTFTITATGNCTIAWAKLEKGSVATPYVPKGYMVELAECKRYFERFKFSEGTDMARQISYSRHINMGATLCTFTVEITPKRALPSIGPFGNICVYIGSSEYAVTDAYLNGYDKDSKLVLIAVNIDKPNETSTNDSRLCLKGLSPDCYFDISCDL